MLDYEEWLEKYEDELLVKYAESGADREMCFDLEKALERDYEKYTEQTNGNTNRNN